MFAIDYLFAAVVALSVLIGLIRGFLREAVSLVTWVLALWAALRFAWMLEPLLGSLDGQPELRLWVARALVFIAVLLCGTLVNYVLSLLVRGTGLTGTDRMLGMAFGFGRGALVVGLLVIGGQYAGMQGASWWDQSLLMPYGERVAEGIRQLSADQLSADAILQDFGAAGAEQE